MTGIQVFASASASLLLAYPANVLLLGQVHSPFGTSTVRTPPQSSITPALVEHVRTYMGEDERENHWD